MKPIVEMLISFTVRFLAAKIKFKRVLQQGHPDYRDYYSLKIKLCKIQKLRNMLIHIMFTLFEK